MEPATRGTFDVSGALVELVERAGSDLCLKVGNRPLIRIDGRLGWLDPDAPELRPDDTIEILHTVLPDARMKEFEDNREVDFAYSIPGLARFRVNAYRQRGTVSMVFRIVPYAIRSLAELGLPDVVRRLAEEERGVVLVTGTTGSGKSTTLAAMIEHINATAFKHIVTIEDPIEYLHRDQLSAIEQREVGFDTDSFATAMRVVLRQDPDVILVGEMRDRETAFAALTAAETGHLVMTTLHTINATETISRIVDFFPPHQQQQIRVSLAGALKGTVAQRLVRRADGTGRIAVLEIMVVNGRIRQCILDSETTSEIEQIVAEGEYYGMRTFDQSLANLMEEGVITLQEALEGASNPHDLRVVLERRGLVRTGIA